jgi:hypothetical protein
MPRERKQIGLRLPDHLADQVTERARHADVSVNHWITAAVEDALSAEWYPNGAYDHAPLAKYSGVPPELIVPVSDEFRQLQDEVHPLHRQHATNCTSTDGFCNCTKDPVTPNPSVSYDLYGRAIRRGEGFDVPPVPHAKPVGSFDPDTDQPA